MMKELPPPKEILNSLKNNQLWKKWNKQHPQSFLSHLFCSITDDFKAKTNWDIGFHDGNKITVFSVIQDGFEIKPADNIFKKPNEKVDELNISKINLSTDEASKICQEKFPEFFPKEIRGDGFIVIQNLKGVTLWNFSFISKTLKFLNMKINAQNGNVENHEEIELLHKQ
jgi:hypothetical protein